MIIVLFAISALWASFLQPEEAFKPKITLSEKEKLKVEIVLGEQIYLYADKLKIEDGDTTDGIELGSVKIDTSTVEHEGEKVYEVSPIAYVHLFKSGDVTGERVAKIKLSYQGCSSAGLCYEPQESVLDVVIDTDELSAKSATLKAEAITSAVVEKSVSQEIEKPASETNKIANVIKGGSLWLILLSFFGFGLLLSLTPCVFPMIPIISSVIIAQGEGIGARRAFFLSLVYVLSMAIAYTIAGILAGLFGANLQAAFQTPWIITIFALVFVALSLSMFDVYQIQIPNFIQSRISKVSGQRSGVIGVAIMGFLSALIVGPCVAAPLAGALIYIGQTGDALLGGVALFALSIGMGIPLLIIGTTSGRFMPRPGMWMDVIKAIFGVMLLGIAIWMMGRVLDENTTLLLWGGLAVFVAVNMSVLEPIGAHPAWSSKSNVKALGLIILLYGMTLLVGGMAGAKNLLHPLDPFIAQPKSVEVSRDSHKTFEIISSIKELDAILAENKGKRVLVDFYADWCTSCKEYEEFTFADAMVKTAMDKFVLVQVDVTANDDASKVITKKYGIFGPPAILFFDENGIQNKEMTIVGFKKPEEFLQHLGEMK
jgi:thiol:disulfide interchange protein DsbD